MANHGSLQLRSAVHHAYSAAAERPTQKHAFPVGGLLAERLGYPAGVLDTLPPECVEAFAGVSNLAVSVATPPTRTFSTLDAGRDSTASSWRGV